MAKSEANDFETDAVSSTENVELKSDIGTKQTKKEPEIQDDSHDLSFDLEASDLVEDSGDTTVDKAVDTAQRGKQSSKSSSYQTGSTRLFTVADPQKVKKRNFVSDIPDRGLFLVVSMGGFAAIIAAKLYHYNPQHVSIAAVVLMCVYAAVAYRMPKVSLRPDRLGDNFYYLGFIFTLASLSAALIELKQKFDVQSILGSFGIALATTIVGIAGRVIFVQMRTEIDEIEAETRRNLLDSSDSLRDVINRSISEFQILRTSMLQAAQEIEEKTINTSTAQIEQLTNLAQTAASSIQQSSELHKNTLNQMDDSIAHLTDSAEKFGEKINNMVLPSAKIESQVSELGHELENLIEKLNTFADRTNAQLDTKKRRSFRFSLFRRGK